MPTTDTPLRYPGGKSQLTPVVIDILSGNNMLYGEYAEPFAGGAGVAMTLLLNDYVSAIYLNDVDPAIYSFWYSVLNHTEDLCHLIQSADVTIAEWHRQRFIFQTTGAKPHLQLGFATLFLNRTNRSGILKAGVIGGLDQTGNFKLDCRFNKADLTRKIRRIGAYRDQIFLSCLDALNFIKTVLPTSAKQTLVNLDPPYFGKGPELYTNFYSAKDHALLAKAVVGLKRRWIVTYDDTPEIRSLYSDYPMYSSSLNYSAQVKRVGIELLVADPLLALPASFSSAKVEVAVEPLILQKNAKLRVPRMSVGAS
jgi:DNA adenine methylase